MARKSRTSKVTGQSTRWIVANGCVTSSKTGRTILALSDNAFVVTTPHTSECVTTDAAGIAVLKLQAPAALAVQAMEVFAPAAKPKAATVPAGPTIGALKRDRGLAKARTSVKSNGNAASRKAARALVKSYDAKIAKLTEAIETVA